MPPQAFVEAVVRLAMRKYGAMASIAQRVSTLLQQDVLPKAAHADTSEFRRSVHSDDVRGRAPLGRSDMW